MGEAWLVTLALVAQVGATMPAAGGGTLEGRPPQGQASPLQARIDAAPPGAVIEVEPGTYTGDLFIDRRIRLVGRGRPRLVGSGRGSVVRVRADDVHVEGFDIDGQLGGSLTLDSSGIHVAARRVIIRDCRISRALFGIYLREADAAVVERVDIEGLRGRDPGDQGSGIHLWNTNGFLLKDNRVRYSRDGIYIQSSPDGFVTGNTVSEVRYGLHYMYSDRNTFEDNTFERSAAGAALMYSRHLAFRRNRFLGNRGFASVGLLLQGCDDVVAEDNLIADNARGIFIEGTHRDVFRRNVIADADVAIVLYGSAEACRFEGNSFVGNLSPLHLVGRRTDTVFDGNYWSDGDATDLDGDGRADHPYRLSNVFDHLRGNLTAADLFAQGLGASMLAAAEEAFPVLDLIPVIDANPLARPPRLAAVPAPWPATRRGTAWGVGVSVSGLLAGLTVFWKWRRARPEARA
jgi:nitrous oxidase accessory protein